MSDELSIRTASESVKRAAILPTVPSEDVSGLLPKIESKQPQQAGAPQCGEYLPCAVTEWVIDVIWVESSPWNARELNAQFKGEEWEALGRPTLFGKDAATGKWTYLVAGNGPTEVTELKAAWSYFESWKQTPVIADTAMFEDRIAAIEKIMRDVDGGSVRASVDPVEAAKRARQLARLHEKFAGEVALQLKAPFLRKFEGRKVWDVMLCLGLRWGDMDLFHWRNETGYGSDSHFSVSTSTVPGYFLPEEVAAGRVQVEDLIFGFSLPRSADPVAVFKGMFAAAQYAKSRLGGKIADLNGGEIDLDGILCEISAEAEDLRREGFAPGSDPALRLF